MRAAQDQNLSKAMTATLQRQQASASASQQQQQQHSMSQSRPHHGLVFPQEDPFAYPVPLSSTTLGGHFSSMLEDPMQDIMQFPVFDAYGDMGAQVFESDVQFPFVPTSSMNDDSGMGFEDGQAQR